MEPGAVTLPSTRLRSLLDGPDPVVGPCVYDCVSARVAEEAGFPLLFHGGYNSASSMLGIPDIGLITMTEMIYSAQNIARAVRTPVLMDVDDGFGDIPNVVRTTREAIRGGLAGLYIEDQVFPKRSPSMGVNKCVSVGDMQLKIRSIAHARNDMDPDFVIMVRTHSSRASGMDEAVERSLAYAEAGAELIFVDPGYSREIVEEEFRRIREEIIPHVRCVANMTENCGRPLYTTNELREMGFSVVFYPLTAIITVTAALQKIFAELRQNGTTAAATSQMWEPRMVKELMNASAWMEMKERILEDGVPLEGSDE